jgi:pilus assembly protein Flp/PilA
LPAGELFEWPEPKVEILVSRKEQVMNSFIATINAVFHTAKGKLQEEKGATMVEYGIMVAFIAVIVMVAVIALGPQIASLFTSVSAAL